METQSLPLFAYGSLVDPRVRERVLGRRPALEVLRARLPGYARFTVPDFDYAYVAPSARESLVEGVLIVGLTAADYELLDDYEDVADGLYERVAVEVLILGCGSTRATSAWVYAWPSAGPRPGSETVPRGRRASES